MMRYSNAQFQALCLILYLWTLGLIQKQISLVLLRLILVIAVILVEETALKIYTGQSYRCYRIQNKLIFISVTSQRYEINILPESIMVGNDAIFKCSIPSFVTDFVYVRSWIDSEGKDLDTNVAGIFIFQTFFPFNTSHKSKQC